MNYSTTPIRRAAARTALVLLLPVLTVIAPQANAATKYAAPGGSANNSGDSRSSAWDAASCSSKLSPGDTCIYVAGNYGKTRFAPTNSGTNSNRIVHRCESLHGCRFDQLIFRGVSYLDVVNLASDTNYYDSSKGYANPRMGIFNSHHLKFDSIYVRGEPHLCASGNTGTNTGTGCSDGYSRYNDLVKIGNAASDADTSWAIEIAGASEFLNGNHSVMQFHGDMDPNFCESNEADIWIHGTPEVPIKFSIKYHHILEFKGACRVLIEHVNLGPAGTGRGDLNQPVNGYYDQAGGTIHGATIQHVIIRYSNFYNGGTATDTERNKSHIEIGTYGDNVNGACIAHNSHFRPWGTLATVSRLNDVRFVKNVSILNNAVSEPWYMESHTEDAANSRYRGAIVARTGTLGDVSAAIDGLVVHRTSRSGSYTLLTGLGGKTRSFLDSPFSEDGLTFGERITETTADIFSDPVNWDFRPRQGSSLINSAVPIARTTNSGSGTVVPVDRPECFIGTMAGMRPGDDISIAGERCLVKDVNLSDGTVTCNASIRWSQGDDVFYNLNGSSFKDIGSSSPGFTTAPKPPVLTIDQ